VHTAALRRGYHALQLEMSKTNYMDDMETRYHEERAAQTAGILKKTLVQLARLLPDRSAAAHA
jgi:N-formylglutamate amidohydrolase